MGSKNNTKKITAVVVTYNRKQLLKECLDALLAQTYPLDLIILIDNASTDGTPEFLRTEGYLSNAKIDYSRLPENIGGSGGFHEGIKRAYEGGADWIWVMDDDVLPRKEALEVLEEKQKALSVKNKGAKIGFLSSMIVWKDGSACRMNIPSVNLFIYDKPFTSYADLDIILVKSCSFVSVLLSRGAIRECGLPIKEYFIWLDDVEYTERITKKGFLGAFVLKSVVVHHTKKNEGADIKNDDARRASRYFYYARNRTHYLKETSGMKFIPLVTAHFIVDLAKALSRKDHRASFLIELTGGYVSGLFFNPKYIQNMP